MNKLSDKAICAARTVLINSSLHSPREIKPDDMYVVWLCKTLQNWKALVSGVHITEHIEVTYNGDKKEFYVDVYTKMCSQCLEDIKNDEHIQL